MALANSAPQGTDLTSLDSTPGADECCIVVDGKDQAISLRQELVRRRIACTFPAPTWQRAKYTFRAKSAALGDLKGLVKSLAPEASVAHSNSV